MAKINANDARTHLIELLEHAEHGEESTIAIRGELLARLGPIQSDRDVERARTAVRRLQDMARSVPEPKITIDEILGWIQEGRRT